MPTCWTCGAEIEFQERPNGKRMPVTVETGNNHFAECRGAKDWSGKTRSERANEPEFYDQRPLPEL